MGLVVYARNLMLLSRNPAGSTHGLKHLRSERSPAQAGVEYRGDSNVMRQNSDYCNEAFPGGCPSS